MLERRPHGEDLQRLVFGDPLGNGQNFFTVLAINGQQISRISLSSTSGFADVQQVRISGLAGNDGGGGGVPGVPDGGATLSLLGSALAGLVLLQRQRTWATIRSSHSS